MPYKDIEKKREYQRRWHKKALQNPVKKQNITENKKRFMAKLRSDPVVYAKYLEDARIYRAKNKDKIKEVWKKYNKTRDRDWDKSKKGKMLKVISKHYQQVGDYCLPKILLNLIERSLNEGEKNLEIEFNEFERHYLEYHARVTKKNS